MEHSIAIFSSESTRRGSKYVLEAVFAVRVEAGDGMQQPSLARARISLSAAIIHSVTE